MPSFGLRKRRLSCILMTIGFGFMKVYPMLQSQFFHFLDWVISQYGLYLFMAFVYLCPFIIWWVHRWAKKHPEANVEPNILIYWIFPPRK